MGTKVDDTMKLNIHWNATAMATAAPRMVLGKISAISTQHIGPQENINDAEYTIMLITEMIGGNDTMLQRATLNAPIPIPMEPVISRGLRPNFSTVNTATRVNEILTIPIMTVCIMGLPIPMLSKIRGAK